MTDDRESYIKSLEERIIELEDEVHSLRCTLENPDYKSTVWKIRHKQTGRWSGGGEPVRTANGYTDNNRWSKTGKVWKNRGSLVTHLRYHTYGALPSNMRGNHDLNELLPHTEYWEVVAVATFDQSPLDISDFWIQYLASKKGAKHA